MSLREKIQTILQYDLKNLLTPANAGKESAMAEAASTATPPATSGGISLGDVERLLNGLAAKFETTIEAKIKPLSDTIGTLQHGHAALSEAVKAVPTGDALAKTVAAQLAATQATAEQAKARATWIGENLKNVPGSYADKLGSDPAKWPDEAKGIRDSFKGDLDKLGIKPAAVTSDSGATATTTATNVDAGKLKGIQLIELAVKQTPAIRPSDSTAPAVGAATAVVGNAGAVAAK